MQSREQMEGWASFKATNFGSCSTLGTNWLAFFGDMAGNAFPDFYPSFFTPGI